MPKTEFENGTVVEPAFLNNIFKNGHVHDGGEDDGHCSPINLSATPKQISGVLPFNHLPSIRFDKFRSGFNMSATARGISVGSGFAVSANVFSVGGSPYSPNIEHLTPVTLELFNSSGTWLSYDEADITRGVPNTAAGWTAVVADGTWLHVFVLGKTTDSSQSKIAVDTDLYAANLLNVGTFDLYRRLGSVMIDLDGSSTLRIMPFNSVGRRFMIHTEYKAPFVSQSGATLPSTQELVTTIVPPGVSVLSLNRVIVDNSNLATCECYVTVSGVNELMGEYPSLMYGLQVVGNKTAVDFEAITSTNQKLRLCSYSSAAVALFIGWTRGWIEEPDTL